MLKLWVKLKTWLAKHFQNIHGSPYIHLVQDEYDFMCSKTERDCESLTAKYAMDKLFGLPFDYAYDSITIFHRLEVDCGLNRVWQMYFTIKGYNAYLVHYTHYPIDKYKFQQYLTDNKITKNIWLYKLLNFMGLLQAHITVIMERDKKYYSGDYGDYQMIDSVQSGIQSIATKYGVKVKKFVIQDIGWQVRKENNV